MTTTLTLTMDAAADDAAELLADNSVSINDPTVSIGSPPAGPTASLWRFDLTPAQAQDMRGATVLSATLTLHAATTDASTYTATMSGELNESALSATTAPANITSRTPTVSVAQAGSDDIGPTTIDQPVNYTSSELREIVQEIVYAYGDDLRALCLTTTHTGGSGSRTFHAYDAGTPAFYPQLSIDYQPVYGVISSKVERLRKQLGDNPDSGITAVRVYSPSHPQPLGGWTFPFAIIREKQVGYTSVAAGGGTQLRPYGWMELLLVHEDNQPDNLLASEQQFENWAGQVLADLAAKSGLDDYLDVRRMHPINGFHHSPQGERQHYWHAQYQVFFGAQQ